MKKLILLLALFFGIISFVQTSLKKKLQRDIDKVYVFKLKWTFPKIVFS